MTAASQITVSVFMLTYNQEHCIAQAVNSILEQKTSFRFQLVIGEDCSTDNTRSICEDYQNKYPDKIKLLPSVGKNIGLINNYLQTIKQCDGKYIAICDGDDYWIDEFKLQKQVDFLEANPDFAIVGTNYHKLFKDNALVEEKKEHSKPYYEFSDLIFKNVLPSVTTLFRNIPKQAPLPNWILKYPYGDWPTYLWVLKNGGKIHFLNDFTAVYRMEIGVSAKLRKTLSDIETVNLNILKDIASDDAFSHKKAIINKSINDKKKQLVSLYNREKKYFKAFALFLKTIFKQENKLRFVKFYVYSVLKSVKLI
ncbi:glycosyltransferase [Neotamlana laminarinivorans]|uniref:Glycosyltransferase n=1 Tax=Neotamlana laminarinivorans TaxID=2883124 RepID=A0A9X1I1G9_9FLAO|nr:glycosyltransferase [Tamlana laminarinivorans]MCB4799705.1 glycosyltransferase [Tamlana laminarinivorans]